MKTFMKTFCLIISLFFYLLADAQVDIGVKGGIGISNLAESMGQGEMSASRKGMYGGLVFSFHVSPSVYLQPEINLSRQGRQQKGIQQVPANIIKDLNVFNGVDLYADYKSSTILNYLEIPLLVKVLLGKRVKYYSCFGPYIGFLISAKTATIGKSLLYSDAAGTIPLVQNDAPYPTVSLNSIVSIKESIKTVNLGVQGGLGIQIPAGTGNIFFEGRTIMGINNIQTHTNREGKIQTGCLVVAAGYLIKLK
jgi:hypothetical protein